MEKIQQILIDEVNVDPLLEVLTYLREMHRATHAFSDKSLYSKEELEDVEISKKLINILKDVIKERGHR